jgi:hypothetical protein
MSRALTETLKVSYACNMSDLVDKEMCSVQLSIVLEEKKVSETFALISHELFLAYASSTDRRVLAK